MEDEYISPFGSPSRSGSGSPQPPPLSPIRNTHPSSPQQPIIEDDDESLFSMYSLDSGDDHMPSQNEAGDEDQATLDYMRDVMADRRDADYAGLAEMFEQEYPDTLFDLNEDDPFEVSIPDAKRTLDELWQAFPPDWIPTKYIYRDSSTNQLISKNIRMSQFIKDPWPNPYVRTIRTIGVSKNPTSMEFPTKDDEWVNFRITRTTRRSRPNHYIYSVENIINWCGVDLSPRMLRNPYYSINFVVSSLRELINRELWLEELLNVDGSISVWFQITIEKPRRVEPREMPRVVFTLPILTVLYTPSLFLATCAIYLSAFMSWKIDTSQDKEYWELVDEHEDSGHVQNVTMFIVRGPERQGGCRGYFGNKYISHRLTKYVKDPESTYNNCLFYCIHTGLNLDINLEIAENKRQLLGIKSGSKIPLSLLQPIAEHYNVCIVLYMMEQDDQGRKHITYQSSHGEDMNPTLSILLKAEHYCLITNVIKLQEFRSCTSCYEWFNTTTKRGKQHFLNCRKCPDCGIKLTAKHNCRVYTPRRKKVRYTKQQQLKFEGIDDYYVADFETFQGSRDTEMKVYAAGIASVRDIKTNVEKTKVKIWYGRHSLNDFCRHLLAMDQKITVVFYNGARFDFWFILRWVLANKIRVGRFVREPKSNKLMVLEFENVRLWDLCLFTMTSLKQLCVDFGVPDKFRKGDFDHRKIFSWGSARQHQKEVKEYLYFDVIALGLCHQYFVDKFWEIFSYPPTKCITLSHLAYDIWRNKFIEPEYLSLVKIPTSGEWEFLRRGVFGGRTLCYRKGFKSNLYLPYAKLKLLSADSQTQLFHTLNDYLVYLDVVSLYPFVSRDPMPIGTPRFQDEDNIVVIEQVLKKENKNPHEIELIQKSYFEVDVECPRNIYIAFLLARGPKGELIADLNDKVKQVYDGFTLLEAMILGYKVTKVHTWLYYPKLGVVLESYMSYCFENKAKYNKKQIEYHMFKGLMNNLTGKYNQDAHENNQYFFEDDSFMAQQEEIGKVTRVEWMKDDKEVHLAYYVETKKAEKNISKPVNLGLHILSTSRVLMSYYTRMFNGYYAEHCPYYCDTDSLIIHVDTYNKFRDSPIFGDKWGQLKNELGDKAKIVAAYFPAPKTYALEYWTLNEDGVDEGKINVQWYIRAKGVPKGDVTCTNPKHYEELAKFVKDKPDLKEVLFSLYTRDGLKLETINTLPFHFFEKMMLKDCYIIVHFGSIKKYLVDENNMGCTVKLNMDLHRSINKERWWDNGKRTMVSSDHMWGISAPRGHELIN